MPKQQQQQPQQPPQAQQQQQAPYRPGLTIERTMFVVEEHKRFMPRRSRAPAQWPEHAPLPRVGEVIYLTAESAWGVSMVIHTWKSPVWLIIEIWIQHVSSHRDERPSGFALTQ